MNLTPNQIKLLRRGITDIDALFAQGLIAFNAGRVTRTPAGIDWLTKDDERIRKARAAGGIKGPDVRNRNTGPRKRKQIAKQANAARNANRKEGQQ